MSSIPVPDERTRYSSRRQDDVHALAAYFSWTAGTTGWSLSSRKATSSASWAC